MLVRPPGDHPRLLQRLQHFGDPWARQMELACKVSLADAVVMGYKPETERLPMMTAVLSHLLHHQLTVDLGCVPECQEYTRRERVHVLQGHLRHLRVSVVYHSAIRIRLLGNSFPRNDIESKSPKRDPRGQSEGGCG